MFPELEYSYYLGLNGGIVVIANHAKPETKSVDELTRLAVLLREKIPFDYRVQGEPVAVFVKKERHNSSLGVSMTISVNRGREEILQPITRILEGAGFKKTDPKGLVY